MSGHGGAEMRVLVEAARTSGRQFEAGSVLRGAATHTGASLLNALRDMGWVLAPADAVGTWEAEFDTEGRVYPHSYERGPDLVAEVATPVWEYRVTNADPLRVERRRVGEWEPVE